MALTIYTAEALSKLPFLEQVDVLKKQVDTLRPLPREIEDRVLQKLRLEWNYHSNAIEGNQLSYGETVAFIMEGITAKGKTLKDHLDIKGHDEAIKYLLDIVKNADYVLNEADIRNLHQLLLKENYFVDAQTPSGDKTRKEIKIGQYKSSPNHVLTATGETHYYASPEQVPMRMGDLMDWYKLAKENTTIHPVILATLFHHEFTAIHPFDDGNGRMGRLLLNLMLLQNGYPPIVVKQNDKLNYYQVLSQADAGEMVPINEYMSTLVEHSLSIYIKAAKGESIEEEDDIDKEIALFKKSLGEDNFKVFYSPETARKFLVEIVFPILIKFRLKLNHLNELFLNCEETVNITAINDDGTHRDLLYNNIEEFLTIHPRTQLYSIQNLVYKREFKGFKKAQIPFNLISTFSVLFLESYALITLETNKRLEIKYDESLDENIQKELITSAITTLLDYTKSRLNG
jgi:Fic family protein